MNPAPPLFITDSFGEKLIMTLSLTIYSVMPGGGAG